MSAPSEWPSLDAASSGNAEGDREVGSNKPSHQRQETTLSDHQEPIPQLKRAKAERKVSSSLRSVSDSSSAQSSQPTQQVPRDRLNEIVAQLRLLQQQVEASAPAPPNHSQTAGNLPSQLRGPLNATQSQSQQLQSSAPMPMGTMSNNSNQRMFNTLTNEQNLQGGAAGGDNSGLMTMLLALAQSQQPSIGSSIPAMPQHSINVAQVQSQQQQSNANNESSPIMAALTQILQQHHYQQRQDLLQQQQLEMQTLHQINNSSNQQQPLMLLLQLFARQQQPNQECQSTPSQPISAPSPQDVQGIPRGFVQNNPSSSGPTQVSSQQLNNATFSNTCNQDFAQIQLLQLLAAQRAKQGQQNFSMYSQTGNREDSLAQGSSVPSTPEGLLQLMAQQLNQMQNNSASLVTTPQIAASSTASSASQTQSHLRNASASNANASQGSAGSFAMMPVNTSMNQNISSASAEDHAQMQQRSARDTNDASKSTQLEAGMFSVEDLKYAFPDSALDNRDANGRTQVLPTLLVMEDDQSQLSAYQTLLRYQIEVFRATETDANTHQRGRNKPIRVNQIGVRCRHCSHLPIAERARGSSYFPSGTAGMYQAGQNMNSTHFQQGVCTEMGEPLRRQFAALANLKSTSTGAGRAYWAKQAKILGLEDNEEEGGGIRFWLDKK